MAAISVDYRRHAGRSDFLPDRHHRAGASCVTLCLCSIQRRFARLSEIFITRLLLSLLLCSLTTVVVRADDAAAAPAPEKSKPAAALEPGITFDWVHVDGPYVAMTFDDGPG